MENNLQINDPVGVTFWIISAAMVAATYFFTVERDRAVGKWKTSLTVAAMVTGIAAIHYFYMREVWVTEQVSPVVFRYVDWLLTVPLQFVEFYLILAAITVVSATLFWKLMIASLVMLMFGLLGELGFQPWIFGLIGLAAWFYILYEIFAGEASKVNAASGNAASQKAYNALKWIVSIGWAIYPIGYFLGVGESGSDATLNIIYNLADFVNKIAFCLAIWSCGKASTLEAGESSGGNTGLFGFMG